MIDDKTLPTPRPEEHQVIQSYGEGRFRISNVVHQSAVLVMPKLTVPWHVRSMNEAGFQSLAPLFAEGRRCEILLFGAGTRAVPLASDLRHALREMGAIADVMDTGAACRTYNVLLAEGRLVAAALLPLV
jgi:uncharacterized protein